VIRRTLQENLRVIAGLPSVPKRALEVGALPGEMSVLGNTPQIAERHGINLSRQGTYQGFEVVLGDARSLPWPDEHFDLIVCASTLEHIPDFWRACDEMRRTLAPGGTLLLSTPGFARLRAERRVHRWAGRLHLPDLLVRGTATMGVHGDADYYRFSELAYREVLMAGLRDVKVWRIMLPPRIFATGTK
jgi:SAM-dependent methyltransferase